MADLVGRQASATFAGTEAGTIGTTLLGYVTDENLSIDLTDVSRWGDLNDRMTAGETSGTVTCAFTCASHTPTIPTGTAAVLVVKIDATKKTTYTSAFAVNIRRTTNSKAPAQPHRIVITFKVTSVSEGAKPMVAT